MKEIQISELSKLCPEKVIRDSQGITFMVGYSVVFNKGGRVWRGIIKSIVKNEWVVAREDVQGFKWWHLKFECTVEGVDGKISTVSNPNSLIVA